MKDKLVTNWRYETWYMRGSTPKDPFVSPKVSGEIPYIPMTWRWDWNPKNPIRSGRWTWILREHSILVNFSSL